MKTLNIKDAAIVTVRNSSTRLPNKAIMKIKDQLRSIDIVISRAKKTGFAVIIATSTDKTDDVFEEIAKEHNVQLFRGALVNKIKTEFLLKNLELLSWRKLLFQKLYI